MKKLFKYLKDYKLQCVMAPLFKMLEAIFELFVPLVMADIIDKGIVGNNLNIIYHKGIILLALAFIGLTCSITAQYFSAKAATGFARQMKADLFKHIQSLSYREMDTLGTSTLITRLTSDANQVQNGVNMVLRLFLRSPFIVFGAMIMAFTIDVKAALIFVVAIPLLTIVVVGITVVTLPMYRKVQGTLDQVTSATRESLTGIRVIRAFNKEEDTINRFDDLNEKLENMQIVTGKLSALTNPVTFIIVNAATIVIIWTGAIRVDSGFITQGQVIALVNYMSQILIELIKLTNLIVTITKSLACANRIADVLEVQSTIPLSGSEQDSVEEASKTSSGNEIIKFEHVGLCYADASEESLTDINLQINRGETIGIIGSTGSGKSSLINLIPRFYDITSGKLYIDNTDIRKLDVQKLRARIGVVPQKAVLFKGTIRDNMLWGNDTATDEEIWAALDAAQASEFVHSKEGELDYEIAQNGKNLSGGQRQRLTIARALVRMPDILILDDSASALDYMTDYKLREAISRLDENMTVFIVSQRTASIMNADRIVVLEDGCIVGTGTHKELLDNCQVYSEIYYSQFERSEK